MEFADILAYPQTRGNDVLETVLFDEGSGCDIGELADARLMMGQINENLGKEIAAQSECSKKCGEECWGPREVECKEAPSIIAEGIVCEEKSCEYEWPLPRKMQQYFAVSVWISLLEIEKAANTYIALATNREEHQGGRIAVHMSGASKFEICIENEFPTCAEVAVASSHRWVFVSFSRCGEGSEIQICLAGGLQPACTNIDSEKISRKSKFDRVVGRLAGGEQIRDLEITKDACDHTAIAEKWVRETQSADISVDQHRVERSLQTITHYAAYAYSGTISSKTTDFVFENTHTSTVYITVTGSHSGGTPTVALSKTSGSGSTIQGPGSIVVTASSGLIPDLSGVFTVRLTATALKATSGKVTIVVGCSAVSSQCYCADGKFANTKLTNCAACPAAVLSCPYAQAMGCIPASSRSTVLPSTFNCKPCFLATQYFDTLTGVCNNCEPTCASCVGPAATQCLTCYTNAAVTGTPGVSECKCNSGFFPGTTAASCSICSVLCKECANATTSGCTQCKPNAALTGTAPTACQCISGYSGTPSNCLACHANCLTCITTVITGCLSCKPLATLSGASPNSCMCSSGYYMSPTGVCTACDPYCLTCTGGASAQCSSCKAHAALAAGVSPSSCACGTGYVGMPDNCGFCDTTCRQCILPGITGCSVCMYNAHLSSGTAPSSCTCNIGFYPSPDVINCRSCYSTCASCAAYGSAQCLSCLSNAQLSSAPPSSCICSPGFYPSFSSSNCVACHVTCAQCRDGSIIQCSACKSNATLVTYYFSRLYGPCKCTTGYFPSLDASNCQSCHPSCLRCSGNAATQCRSCKAYAILSVSSCLCRAGYYMNSASVCQPCDGNCLTCSGDPKTCLSCVAGAALSSGTCSCPAPGNTNCLGCDPSCQLCTGAGPAYCTICKSNAQLETSPGLSACKCVDGFYPNPTAGLCTLCSGFCLTCSGPLVTDCSTCTSHAYLELGEEPSACKCEDGYGNSSSTLMTCVLCDVSCVTCAGSANNQCLSCFQNAKLETTGPCKCVCLAGFYPNPDSSICEPCDSTCSQCSTGLPTGCTACFANAGIDAGACICIAHYYPNPTSSVCAICHIACKECVGSNVNDCKVCPVNSELEFGLSPGKCVCSATFFTTTDASGCISCSSTCQRCTALGATICTACYTHAHLSYGSCVCDSLYSPLPDSAHCGACDPTCNTCNGLTASSCLTCYLNASVVSGVCICSVGFRPNLTSANCQPCFYSCKTCNGDTDSDCLTCYPNAMLLAGKCTCTIGLFLDVTSKSCQACHSTCNNCLDSTATGCTECFANASIVGGIPGACTCLSSYFPNTNASTCSACDVSCQTCSLGGATGCQTCNSGAQLNGAAPNSCSCLSGFYPNASVCDPCHSTCLSCSGALSTQCTSCSPPLFLVSSISSGTCACPPSQPFNPITQTCIACAATCQLCSGSTLSECMSCFPNAEIENQASVGRCVCKSSFYPNPDESVCAQCYATCKECVGGGENQCTACMDLAKVNNGKCECGEDAFPNPDSTKCKMCSNLCFKCNADGPKMCTSCRDGAFLKSTAPSECVCNSGFFPSPDVSQCLPCAPGCNSCTGPAECSGCKANAVFINGSCTCLNGFVGNPDASNCVQCPVGCLTCEPVGCNQCSPGLLIVDGKCSETCPPGYMADSNLTCQPLNLDPPTPLLTVNSDNSLLINFDKPMNCSLNSSDLSISVEDLSNMAIDVAFSEPVAQDSQSWLISLQIEEKSLVNESHAILTFLYPEKVTGLNGVPIEISSLSGVLHSFAPPPPNNTTPGALLRTSAASTAAATSKGGVSAGVATSLMNGNPASLISLINQLQLITYLSMSKLPIPDDFASTLAALNVGEMVPNPLSGLFSLSINESSQTPPRHVANYGIDSTLFLVNSVSFFMSASAVLLSFVPIFLLSKVKIPVVAKYFGGMLPSLQWGVPLNLWLTAYLDMGVFCLLQVLNTKKSFENTLTGVSTVLAFTAAVMFVITPVALIVFMYRNFNYISSRSDAAFNKRWGVLFDAFKPSASISGFAYYPIFVIRRLVLAVTLTAAADSQGLIAVLNTSIGVLVSSTQNFIYLMLIRPYGARIDQIESQVIEGSTTLIYLIASSFLLDLPANAISTLSSIGVWTVRVSIFLNVFISLARTVLNVIVVLKLYSERMKLVHTRYKLQDVISSTTRGEALSSSEISDSRNIVMSRSS